MSLRHVPLTLSPSVSPSLFTYTGKYTLTRGKCSKLLSSTVEVAENFVDEVDYLGRVPKTGAVGATSATKVDGCPGC